MKKYLLGVFILISSLQIWAQTTAPKEEWNYKYDQYFSYAGSGRGYALDNFSKGKNKLVGVGMTFYSANDSEARLQGLIFFNDKGQESTSALLNCSIRGSVATRPTCGASVVSYKVIPTDDEGFLLISPDSVRKYTSTNQLQWKTAVANKSQKAVSAGSGIYYVLGTDAVYQLKESGQIVVTKKITVASISTVSDIAPTNSGEFTVTGTLGTYRYNKDGKILNSNLASQGNSIIATNNDFFYVVSGNTVLKLSGSLVQVGKYDIIGIKVTTLAADQTLALIASNTLVKLKSDLSVQWSAVGNFMDVTVTTDGGVAATNSGTITKYSMEGKVKWSKTYTDASGINVFPASDGGLFYRKVTSQNNSDLNKLAPDCSLTALITAPSSTAICTGTSLKLTAKLTSTASTAYSYQWKKDSVNVGTNSAEFTASQAGKYSVVVTQGTCAATSNELTITLTALPTLTAITGNRDEICEGTTITLATKASGGSGSVYTYQWKRNEVDSSGANLASLAVKTSGTYSVTAKDTNGCVSKPQSTVVTIIKPMLYITPAYTSNQRNWLCSADKDSVRLQIYAGPNFKAETYSWTRNGTEISKSSAPIYVKDAAEYTLEISNSNGCKAKSPLVKTEIFPSPKAYAGPNATLTGSEVYDLKKLNVITASGGTPGYTYYWAALPGSQSYSEANPTFAPFTSNTKVILTLVDSKNCVASDTAYVQVNSCKIRTSIRAANNLTYVCSGNTLTLLGSVLDTLGAVKYSWREGNTVVGTGKNVSISKAGSYYLSVEDSKGCMSTSNIQVITLKDSPKPVITGDTSYCKGGGALLTAVVTGGQPSYRYKWELGTVPVTDGTSRQYNASAPGSYYVTVTDTLGCYTRSTVKVITEKGADLVSNITPATSLQVMEPDSVILNAPSGLNYNYLWRKDNANVTGANGARLVLKGSRSSGSYVVIVSRDECSVPSQSVMVRIEAPTAVEPTSPQIAVLVAPNPARNRAVVSVTLPQASSAQIQLYNLMGQPLVSQGSSDVSKNHRFELDLSSLSSGLFIWKVQAGNQSRQGRLIKNDE